MIQKNFSMNLIVAALVATISLLFASAPEAAEPNRVVIEINTLKFAPQKPVLNVGDVVIWKNNDIVPHTATALDGSWIRGPLNRADNGKPPSPPRCSPAIFASFIL